MSHLSPRFPVRKSAENFCTIRPVPTHPNQGTTMRTRSALLPFSLAVTGPAFALSASTESDATHASSYLKTLPNIPPPVIDAAQIVTLAALPLSCLDNPQDPPDHPHD